MLSMGNKLWVWVRYENLEQLMMSMFGAVSAATVGSQKSLSTKKNDHGLALNLSAKNAIARLPWRPATTRGTEITTGSGCASLGMESGQRLRRRSESEAVNVLERLRAAAAISLMRLSKRMSSRSQIAVNSAVKRLRKFRRITTIIIVPSKLYGSVASATTFCTIPLNFHLLILKQSWVWVVSFEVIGANVNEVLRDVE